MNDKIKLFNEQAIKYAQESLNDIAIVNKSGIMYNYNDLYTEKFAELIVRECIGVVEGGSFLHEQAPTAIFARECSGAIKRHFGVDIK